LTLICSENSESSKASVPATAPVFGRAAALIRMSTPPSPSVTASTMSRTDWSSPVSQLTAITRRPDA
jgi:hypothetical protein